MRKINGSEVAVFCSLLLAVLALAGGSAWLLSKTLPPSDFRGIATVAVFVASTYLFAALIYRITFSLWPLPIGDIPEGSRAEFFWNLHQLFFLVLFFSVIRSHVVPIPLTRLVYLALGARLGANTYSGGAMLDPALTTLGSDCIIGHDAVLFAHAIEGRHLALHPISIGNGVTIGAHAVIMPGVQIGDGAIVAVGAVVTKGQIIGAGELWGGAPARRLR